jgi:ectoine hydroxylase-related dioxygenase (phytanoyl-CoA dioxygenase family)
MTPGLPTSDQINAFRRDGAVHLPGAFAGEWAARLAAGVEVNRATPGPYAHEYAADGEGFFGDYCNWQRLDDFRAFVFESPAGEIAAALMGAGRVQFFHDHVLVKAPGALEATPWHHDYPYYCLEATKTVSLWIALDPVPEAVSPCFVAGSHAWGKLFVPRYFKDGSAYPSAQGYEPVPDIDGHADDYQVLAWDMAPGDAIAFDFRTLHAAPGNPTAGARRAASMRWFGEGTTYAERPQPPSPPYPEMGIDLKPGDPMPTDWFPVVWPRGT